MAKGIKTGGRKKGSPNKNGRDLRALAQAYTKEALETLVAIMLDKSAPQHARAMAADKILDRGWGKPSQALVGDAENPFQPSTRIEMVIVDPKPTIDRPPEEPREEWMARRHRELGIGPASVGAAAGATNGRDHG
jgi:hypothetical protein